MAKVITITCILYIFFFVSIGCNATDEGAGTSSGIIEMDSVQEIKYRFSRLVEKLGELNEKLLFENPTLKYVYSDSLFRVENGLESYTFNYDIRKSAQDSLLKISRVFGKYIANVIFVHKLVETKKFIGTISQMSSLNQTQINLYYQLEEIKKNSKYYLKKSLGEKASIYKYYFAFQSSIFVIECRTEECELFVSQIKNVIGDMGSNYTYIIYRD